MPRDEYTDQIERLVRLALELPVDKRMALLDTECERFPPEVRGEIEWRLKQQQGFSDGDGAQSGPHVPDANPPTSDVPDSTAPNSNAPDSNAPDSNAPDSNAPNPNAPNSNAPNSNAPDSNAPGSAPASSTPVSSETSVDDLPASDFRSVGDLKLPRLIGRYRATTVVGHGGFGFVLLATDDSLDREVAIKVPKPDKVSRGWDLDNYLSEARMVAQLDHPHILSVYDVGRDDYFGFFIVSKYVEGQSLQERLEEGPFECIDACRLIAKVASALHYAHIKGFVHRDIKPANILLDARGEPYVTDFGIALREESVGRGPRYTGSPPYMSPEQASGEGHRVDGRSDIFSLGIVLYELLVGRRPFRADSESDLQAQIVGLEPKPLRQIDDNLPREVERICMKALAKRASERYTTAMDLADEMNDTVERLATSSIDSFVVPILQRRASATRRQDHTVDSSSYPGRVRIIPKGMRSYDSGDKDFFFELVPGPRDRFGVPDSIRLWKSKIERVDSTDTFPVGLIYGPSGCGKSSLVKAGLLPSLSPLVMPIYLEATASDTSHRIANSLHRRFPDMPRHPKLNDTMRELRCGSWIPKGEKVLIILDQFEQWLHAHRATKRSRLVKALRQCDGERLQCVVMVRDDFWMAATRFMRELEVPLVENHNSNAVDLFPIQHARKVLTAFGRAYNVLPQSESAISEDQIAFVNQAVDAIAHEGQVICVRLALLAEMMKNREWTPQTLRNVGGTQGLGETYLEETFNSSSSSPEHRYHQHGAREILRTLLPDVGMDIRGHMRSHAELLHASGYDANSEDFEHLIDVLDRQLRLITPTDPDGLLDAVPQDQRAAQPAAPLNTQLMGLMTSASHTSGHPDDSDSSDLVSDESGYKRAARQKYYQLTHDFLIPSVRNWLSRKRRETRRGRAELVLEERSAEWNARPARRNLPSGWEWVRIRSLTRSKRWTDAERRMMRRADRAYLLLAGTAMMLVMLLTASIWQLITANRKTRTETLVQSVLTAPPEAVPYAIERLIPLRRYAIQPLDEQLEREDLPITQRLHALAALAELQQIDTGEVISLIQDLPGSESSNVIQALSRQPGEAIQTLRILIKTMDEQSDWQRKTRYAITSMYLSDTAAVQDMLDTENRSDFTQRAIWIDRFSDWTGPIAELPDYVAEVDSPGLRSGIALAVGTVGISRFDIDTRQRWQTVFQNWYLTDPDGDTHSAAGWALRQLEMPVPRVATSSLPTEQKEWCHTAMGLRLIAVPKPPPTFRSTKGQPLTYGFLIADREITRRLFEAFVVDTQYDGEVPDNWPGVDPDTSPTDDHPAQQINWFDAVRFCNWLSWREKRQNAYQLVSRRDAESEIPEEWQEIENADGYRLPTVAEWEYACLAGGGTPFSFGLEYGLLAQYATFRSPRASPVGSKFCNAFGLFDVEGNVWEWCMDRSDKHAQGRIHKGGAWNTPARKCLPRAEVQSRQDGRMSYLGFRPIVRYASP